MASRNFNGTLDPPAVGTAGWALTASGDAIISSDLILGGGIVGDTALANPAHFANGKADNNSTTFTVAGGDIAVATIAVPSGFTTAEVLCFVSVGNSRNTGAGATPFYGQAWVGKAGGAFTASALISSTCADSSSLSLSVSWADTITGLTPGDSVQGGAWAAVDSTAGWKPNAGNGHAVVAVTFLR
jgi:hypothetical protein